MPRRSPRRAVVLGIASGIALGAVLSAAGLLVYRSSPTPVAVPGPQGTTLSTLASPAPRSSSPRPTPSATPKPVASPDEGPSPPRTSAPPTPRTSTPPISQPEEPTPDLSLQDNSLYAIDLGKTTVDCDLSVRSPRPPLKDSALGPYLRDVVDCLMEAFDQPLAEQGFDLTKPKIKTYAKKITTPCGKYGQDAAPAYYCSSTETIYWPEGGDEGDEAYTFARLGYVGLLAHEFGHHLQDVTGMLNNYGVDYYSVEGNKAKYALSRRLELQAQCFEGVFLRVARKRLDYTQSDTDELHTWHSFTGDEDPPKSRLPDHGSSKTQIAWLDRGIDSADFGRCNTWSASRKSVS